MVRMVTTRMAPSPAASPITSIVLLFSSSGSAVVELDLVPATLSVVPIPFVNVGVLSMSFQFDLSLTFFLNIFSISFEIFF